jgi:hypothetical protein
MLNHGKLFTLTFRSFRFFWNLRDNPQNPCFPTWKKRTHGGFLKWGVLPKLSKSLDIIKPWLGIEITMVTTLDSPPTTEASSSVQEKPPESETQTSCGCARGWLGSKGGHFLRLHSCTSDFPEPASVLSQTHVDALSSLWKPEIEPGNNDYKTMCACVFFTIVITMITI